jgi:chloramphenicol 3-O phosphotransferase
MNLSMSTVEPGKIILLNGPSSAGKSTLCTAIQAQIDQPFLQFSLDFFFFNSPVLPKQQLNAGTFQWSELRPRVFDGFFNCLPALALAGNNLVIEYIIETQAQWDALRHRLEGFDVFLIGVHCPLLELERREHLRGDRRAGDARRDLETVHTFTKYDFEIDSSEPAEENATRIIAAWKSRGHTSVLAGSSVDAQS